MIAKIEYTSPFWEHTGNTAAYEDQVRCVRGLYMMAAMPHGHHARYDAGNGQIYSAEQLYQIFFAALDAIRKADPTQAKNDED